jgi:RimJ/RimL family protein N-acetyltransferase
MPQGSDRPVVALREVVDADLDELFHQQADPVSARMAAFPSRDRESFDAKWEQIRADPNVTLRTITADAQVAGHAVAWEETSGRHVIGYWIGRDHWGRGIATEALLQLLQLVPHRPLYADVAAHNTGSIRVLEKCGFARISSEPQHDDVFGEIVMMLFALE